MGRRTRSRRGALAIASAAAALSMLMLAPAANAVVYCVPNDSIDGNCDLGQGQATVQGALGAAQSSGTVADAVLIDAGTFTETLTYFSTNPANTIQVFGRGTANTHLTYPSTVGMNTGLAFTAPAGSVLDGFSMTIPTNADVPAETGISLGGGALAQNVLVDGPTATNGIGVQMSGSAAIEDSTVNLPIAASPSPTNTAVRGSSGAITDSTLRANTGRNYSGAGGSAVIERSTIEAHVGAAADVGTIVVRNSVIELDGTSGAVGVQAANFNNSTQPIVAEVEGTTIVGGGANSTGVQAVGDSTAAGEDASASVANTIISGPTKPLEALADRGETASITSDYSNYDPAGNVANPDLTPGGDTGTATITETNQTNLAPDFVDSGAGDYHLLATSPLIDIGDPAAPLPGETDIDGDPRALEGPDLACPSARDIGADEFPGTALVDCIPPQTLILSGPSGLTADRTPTFGFSSEPGASFQCRIDAQPFAACSGPGNRHTPAALADGAHVLAVRAIDSSPQSNVDPTPATRAFRVDATAPETTIDSRPKRKSRKRKARFAFSSSEPATFLCSVDGAPYAPCASPVTKRKLRRGKHRFDVLSTDRAGNRDPSAATFFWKVLKRRGR